MAYREKDFCWVLFGQSRLILALFRPVVGSSSSVLGRCGLVMQNLLIKIPFVSAQMQKQSPEGFFLNGALGKVLGEKMM